MSIVSIILLVSVLFLVFVIFYYVPIGLWVQSVVSLGLGRITILDLIRMRLRKIPPRLVTDSVINSHKAGLDTITTEDLETHFLAGGNVANVVSAMIAADKAKIELPFTTATAIDLAGRDVKTAVQTSVYPKVIDAPKKGTLAAVAKDGIDSVLCYCSKSTFLWSINYFWVYTRLNRCFHITPSEINRSGGGKGELYFCFICSNHRRHYISYITTGKEMGFKILSCNSVQTSLMRINN